MCEAGGHRGRPRHQSMNLDTPIQYLKGVGPHLAELLQKKSLYTAWDMLFFLPIKYVDRRCIHTLKTLQEGKKQTFVASVISYDVKPMGRGRRRLDILVGNDGFYATLVFFQFHEASLQKRFPVGSAVLCFGDVKYFRGIKNCVHPEMEIWDAEEEGMITPFYSLTEGLYQKTLRHIFHKNLEDLLQMVADDPRSVRDEVETVKISLTESFRYLHLPPVDANLTLLNERRSPAHQRVIYDEFFYLQLGLISKRYQSARKRALVMGEDTVLHDRAVASLPFQLTQAQQTAIAEIRADFLSGRPMNRLVQGDVGCGKTMVAFLASLYAIANHVQVTMMAPTEILAEQHFKKFLSFENDLGIRVELLTSSVSAKQRTRILGELRSGLVNILVGTQALLTPDVQFSKLGFVIIDEQHRFGVMQRVQLKKKAIDGTDCVPHMLVMTATPIPRTLSMSLYGDLDVSVIREMPAGRKPVHTKVFWEKSRATVYDLVMTELKKGRQIYFVYPLVEESEKLDLKNATDMFQELQRIFVGARLGLLHGKMHTNEKDATMQAFKTGEIQILVSTTVIEVGVDVANASVMVVEHAERFGLSQLHQLRGRVGRGHEKSFCYLIAGYARSQESSFRLRVMEDTTDGFVIAEEDLKLRGPGEFLGTKQSGLPDFRLAELVRDAPLLSVAKKRAEEILKSDPHLMTAQNQNLKNIMLKRWGQRLDLVLS